MLRDSVCTVFLFQANPNFVAVGSLKDVEEVDVSCLFSPEPLMWTDDEGEREQNERRFSKFNFCLIKWNTFVRFVSVKE